MQSELQQLSAASVGVEQEAGNTRPSMLSKRPRRTKSVKALPRKKSGVNVCVAARIEENNLLRGIYNVE